MSCEVYKVYSLTKYVCNSNDTNRKTFWSIVKSILLNVVYTFTIKITLNISIIQCTNQSLVKKKK